MCSTLSSPGRGTASLAVGAAGGAGAAAAAAGWPGGSGGQGRRGLGGGGLRRAGGRTGGNQVHHRARGAAGAALTGAGAGGGVVTGGAFFAPMVGRGFEGCGRPGRPCRRSWRARRSARPPAASRPARRERRGRGGLRRPEPPGRRRALVRADERAELPPAPVERLPGESLEVVRGLGMMKSRNAECRSAGKRKVQEAGSWVGLKVCSSLCRRETEASVLLPFCLSALPHFVYPACCLALS